MKKGMLCVFAFVLLISLASAKNITMTYPASVVSGQTFEVNLTLLNFSEGVYSIKIDVYNTTDDSAHRLSRIYNGTGWQSTYDYVENAINTSCSNSSIFLLNITVSYNGTANITVRVNSSSNTFNGYFIDITPAAASSCTAGNNSCGSWSSCNSSGNQTRTCTNTSATCVNATWTETRGCNSTNSTSSTVINTSIDMSWTAADIVNSDEFEIEIKAYNLDNKTYAVKLWIEPASSSSIITDRYDGDNDEWKSGTYWVYNFFFGPGNKTETISLKMRDDYQNFSGNAVIFLKIKNDTEKEINMSITILQEDDSGSSNSDDSSAPAASASANDSSGSTPIVLGSKPKNYTSAQKNGENSIVYKSKSEYIKEYAPYAFSLLCIAIIVLLIIDRQK